MISYKPLKILLMRANKNTIDLINDLSISPSTLAKINNDRGIVSLEVIDKIANYINSNSNIDVSINDILVFTPDSPGSEASASD